MMCIVVVGECGVILLSDDVGVYWWLVVIVYDLVLMFM